MLKGGNAPAIPLVLTRRGLGYRILQAMAREPSRPVTSYELARKLGLLAGGASPEVITSRQSRVNSCLHRALRAGLVAIAGERYSGNPSAKRQPSIAWAITPRGAAMLGRAGRAVITQDAAKTRHAARKAITEAARAGALACAWQHYGPQTPRAEREAVIVALRAVPCTLQEVADVFGLTRERVRQIERDAERGDYD